MTSAFLGVDVGTGSARAGIFDERGRLLGVGKHAIATWKEAGVIAEQSTDDIWNAVCMAVRTALTATSLPPDAIKGIGFDATCSLAVIGRNDDPLPVGTSGDPSRNVIVWMDHRAEAEAEEINSGRHDVLRYVGGRISPEMQTPKLLWLKRYMPESYRRAAHFFDLPDYLTWRASGSLARSSCSTTCKWTYIAHEDRWDANFFGAIGLSDLAEDSFARLGTRIVKPGTPLGRGLTRKAAEELGLVSGTPVGASLIDAHAGGIGTVGAASGDGGDDDIIGRLAYVFGTSACSMATTREPQFVDGVWGPYFSAMVPDLWLNEGGHSAAGAAIDYIVQMHPASGVASSSAAARGIPLVEYLEELAVDGLGSRSDSVHRAGSIHVLPEFLGNRSPLADPSARAVIAGLDLDQDEKALAALYVAGLCGLGYGLRQLLEAFEHKGMDIRLIVASGGAARSGLALQLLADTTRKPVAVTENEEPVLLGAAILGARGAGAFQSIEAAMRRMSSLGRTYLPAADGKEEIHLERYDAFLALQDVWRRIR